MQLLPAIPSPRKAARKWELVPAGAGAKIWGRRAEEVRTNRWRERSSRLAVWTRWLCRLLPVRLLQWRVFRWIEGSGAFCPVSFPGKSLSGVLF